MSYLDDETSVEDSRPREGYEFQLPAVTYRIASGSRDIEIGGNIYRALTISRGEIEVSAAGQLKDLVVHLPVSHPIPQRYLATGVPPRRVLVNVWRQQARSGQAERIWTGYVTSLSCEGNKASFLVPGRTSDLLNRRLPTVTSGRKCPHVLYDTMCRVSRPAFLVNAFATVNPSNRKLVTLSTISGKPDHWAQFGELVHASTGERMTVLDQVGTLVTLQLPIYELVDGDLVQLYAGCDHTLDECLDKFNNVANFGGFPELPKNNIFIPTNGLGVITQA